MALALQGIWAIILKIPHGVFFLTDCEVKAKVYARSATLALLCVLLILFAGFAQATHVHASSSSSSSHECCICSVAHSGALISAAYRPVPVLTRSVLVRCQDASPNPLLLAFFLYIRPPPSA